MKKQTYLTKIDLKDRGWTDKSIKYFIITPDKLVKHVSKSLPTYLYSLDRVKEIEGSSDFDAYNQWHTKSKAIGQKSSEVFISHEINIPIFKQNFLYQKACKYWYICQESYYLECKQYDVVVKLPNYKYCSKLFLHHITVNYLKTFVNQDRFSNSSIGTEKKRKFMLCLYQKVKEIYPYLTQECEIQIAKISLVWKLIINLKCRTILWF